MRVFTLQWSLLPSRSRPATRRDHATWIRIDAVDEHGTRRTFERLHRGWIGVCTDRIAHTLGTFQEHFPGHQFTPVLLHARCRKVLPYFQKRLERRLAHPDRSCCEHEKPFYKVYTDAPVQDVGRFFARQHKIGYYEDANWLVRLYVDLCGDTQREFYHKWYDVDETCEDLLQSFAFVPDYDSHTPPLRICAFDLETANVDGLKRIPDGHHPADRVVMASAVVWNFQDPSSLQKHLLYLDPLPAEDTPLPVIAGVSVRRFRSERQLLLKLHLLFQTCHVLTGYNIDRFDVPCLIARLTWLRMKPVLAHYSSERYGDAVAATFQHQMVMDLYPYFKTFSNYDLPSFKLDDVARVKLRNHQLTKLAFNPVGIHAYYDRRHPVEKGYRAQRPPGIPEHLFGTFDQYLAYALRDSEVVHALAVSEQLLSFLLERGNLGSVRGGRAALYTPISKYLKHVFKTVGSVMGFFFNERFLHPSTERKRAHDEEEEEEEEDSTRGKYQGAVNFCKSGWHGGQEVAVLDFKSMYPNAIVKANLCYGTCLILRYQEWLQRYGVLQRSERYDVIPFRNHDDRDFAPPAPGQPRPYGVDQGRFAYPAIDREDERVVVIDRGVEGFLPAVLRHFLSERDRHQRAWKQTGLAYHFNAQLNCKTVVNSLYGVTGSRFSDLAHEDVAKTTTMLCRNHILGAYHFVEARGSPCVYVDTDSTMVLNWPHDHCDAVNAYLNSPYVELKFEMRMHRLLVLSKKRYVYVAQDGSIHTKGFQKRANALTHFLVDSVLKRVVAHLLATEHQAVSLDEAVSNANDGWIFWIQTLVAARVMCYDPRKYAITRKTKRLDQYRSTTCPTYRMLRKYPEKENEFIEYSFSRADGAEACRSQWIEDVQEVNTVDVERLFVDQEKILVGLLNTAFWHLPEKAAWKLNAHVLNTMHWKCLVNAELLHWHQTHRKIVMLIEKGVRYTFRINDHLREDLEGKRGRRKKLN